MTEKASLAAAHDGLISTREGLASLVNQAQTVTEEFELTVEGLRRASTETEGLLGMEERGRSLLTPSEDLTQWVEAQDCFLGCLNKRTFCVFNVAFHSNIWFYSLISARQCG